MTRDAAAADVGVEARHRAAFAMLDRFLGYDTLEETLARGLARCSTRCLDDAAEVEAVLRTLLAEVRASRDAAFLRELLGADSADRMTRMHAHGALAERAAQAAWRLAGGE